MAGYIFNDKRTYDIFIKTENILRKKIFPIMNKFENDEIDFWIDICKRYLDKGDALVEMGVGSGRILCALSKRFNVYGFDNDRFFIRYCRKRKLKVFYADATKKVSKNNKGRYKIAGISFNTLFNFPKEARLKWVAHAFDLLKDQGFLIITCYSYSGPSIKTISDRIKFYENVLDPPKNTRVEFYSNKERGIRLCDITGKEYFFSRWCTKSELLNEIKSWKNFRIVILKLLECKIGWKILLKKTV